MYLNEISLTNFRQFGIKEDGSPGVTVHFNKNFNVLVGENDAGKTAIIDGIKYLLGSVSEDFTRISPEDFYLQSNKQYTDTFSIDGVFTDLTEKEAGSFLEWLSFDEDNKYQLRVSLKVKKKRNQNGQEFIERIVSGGEIHSASKLSGEARNLLKATYLKPLRDASLELKPGYKSRLAQILKVHPAFKDIEDGENHELVDVMKEANKEIENFFSKDYKENHSLISDVEKLLKGFYDRDDQSKSKTKFSVSETDLTSILRKLSLDNEEINLGLGNLNLLFIAAELLLLNNEKVEEVIGPQITLIEEIEAHLHTQAQIRLIKYLESELKNTKNSSQFILTSHSPNLVSSVNPRNLIMLHEKNAYPLAEMYTELQNEDYLFLERFLDATKSNLFFAKGLILVEGDSEMLLIPALAELIGYPLHKHGISLVNVGGTSFERYIKLFSRSNLWTRNMNYSSIKLPISIITDIDVKPLVYYESEGKDKSIYSIGNEEELGKVEKIVMKDIEKLFIGNEYSTIKKLAQDFKIEITETNTRDISEVVTKNITREYLEGFSREKEEAMRSKYSIYNANLQPNIAPHWTLEYSLALSVLAPLLLQSIHEIRYKNPYGETYKQIYEELNSKFSTNNPPDEQTAYEIFKPLNDKNVSKAEVAQLMAIKIYDISNPEVWKDKILADSNLKYLIDAILHSGNIIRKLEEEE